MKEMTAEKKVYCLLGIALVCVAFTLAYLPSFLFPTSLAAWKHSLIGKVPFQVIISMTVIGIPSLIYGCRIMYNEEDFEHRYHKNMEKLENRNRVYYSR